MKKIILNCLMLLPFFAFSQTDIDGIMMSKKNFCVGAVYESSSWNHYWEGTFKRENLNMGTVATNGASIMGNYGLSNKLNVIFSLPYLKTSASSGTMIGQKGLQDFSLTLKYMPYEKKFKNSVLSFYALGSFSVPTTDYVADYLPLSIGMHSKNATLRLMTDYQYGSFFATASAAYIKRSNVTIDRNAYFTTEIHYTNEVNMPNVANCNFRIGYRSDRLIAEAIFDKMVTQRGGFDITKNNMPFLSNRMNASKVGFNSKYTFKKIPELSLVGGYNQVIDGRNVGESQTFYGGVFYVITFNKKTKKDEK